MGLLRGYERRRGGKRLLGWVGIRFSDGEVVVVVLLSFEHTIRWMGDLA